MNTSKLATLTELLALSTLLISVSSPRAIAVDPANQHEEVFYPPIEALDHPEYGDPYFVRYNRKLKNHPQPCDRFDARKFHNPDYHWTKEENQYFEKNNCPLG